MGEERIEIKEGDRGEIEVDGTCVITNIRGNVTNGGNNVTAGYPVGMECRLWTVSAVGSTESKSKNRCKTNYEPMTGMTLEQGVRVVSGVEGVVCGCRWLVEVNETEGDGLVRFERYEVMGEAEVEVEGGEDGGNGIPEGVEVRNLT